MLTSQWTKSTRSWNAEGNCVEARHVGHVEIRDSKHPEPVLQVDRAAWTALLAFARSILEKDT